ncbi:hypothetical protein Daus18300_001066 [Diaporthe australafricana]|uniref:Xylanolytic transcriptional activator regulatory domain-containing protein n=1 Tax=Diaporthe australafricana TaxID=127596 RepID=A0ABR3XYY0_9PEZI
MHTIASAKSMHTKHLSEALSLDTRQKLEIVETAQFSKSGVIQLEQVQAWLLLAYYELLEKQEYQAMITAGRAFRLVQLCRLNEIDALEQPSTIFPVSPTLASPQNQVIDTFVRVEEKRRAFWIAYGLDTFLSLRCEWPITFHEEAIRVRLPAPESSFKDDRTVRMSFLSDAMTESGRDLVSASPFAESMVFATIYQRCMKHRAESKAASPGSAAPQIWDKHEELSHTLDRYLQKTSHETAGSGGVSNVHPLRLFSYMLAQSCIIYLSRTTAYMQSHAPEHQLSSVLHANRARQAAERLARFVKLMPLVSSFKAHPFLPSAIAAAANYLLNGCEGGSQNAPDAADLLQALRNLQDVNNLAKDVLLRVQTNTLDIPEQGGAVSSPVILQG